MDTGHTALLPVWHRVSAKISRFKLKQVYATRNTSIIPGHPDTRRKSQRLLWSK
jgi:hypothetical protein